MARTSSRSQAPASVAPAEAAGDVITVRMYRGLLGDCFLLTHAIGDRRFRALIDCGVLQAIGNGKTETQRGVDHMADVVQSLFDDTGGVLDLVIGTHEHYDHLSGFILHFDLWKRFTIRAVWLAWTENYADALANDIRAGRSKGLEALSALVTEATSGSALPFGLEAKGELDERIARTRDLLQFYGEIEPAPMTKGQALAAAAERSNPPTANRRPVGRPPKIPPRSCLDVLDWLKSRVEPGKLSYLEPGQQMRFGLDERLQASVLGPPRTRDRLLRLDPSSGAAREVYLTKSGDVEALATTLKLRRGGASAATVATGGYPFSERFRRQRGERSADPLAKLYYSPGALNEQRRIDGEWLGSAETLALKIDGDVNNTSLALAIEVPGRDVLLFPADAQVGNWLSWHDQKYPAKRERPDAVQETAEQILARVVFYKVGHHASHNATAGEKGLELMTSPDLVAMIPVVEAVAKEQKTKNNPDGWAMPYADLYKRLNEKTRSRIVKGDGDPATEASAFVAAKGRFVLSYADRSASPLWAELALACAGSVART